MKTELFTIYDFARLSQAEKEEMLQNKAILIENYKDGVRIVTVYYIPGFFVEVTTCSLQQKLIDIVPYKRGYKLEKNIDVLYENTYQKHLLVA